MEYCGYNGTGEIYVDLECSRSQASNLICPLKYSASVALRITVKSEASVQCFQDIMAEVLKKLDVAIVNLLNKWILGP